MRQKTNKLTLIRSPMGGGKTFLATKLAKENNGVCVCADDFFTLEDGTYQWTGKLISVAHEWCFGQTFYHLFRDKNVYVHNVFCEKWQMEKFCDLACSNGYPWEILEPNTKWKFDAKICFEKNTHNVPLSTIESTIAKWESTASILKAFEKYKMDI